MSKFETLYGSIFRHLTQRLANELYRLGRTTSMLRVWVRASADVRMCDLLLHKLSDRLCNNYRELKMSDML